jgi:hypothetical protein
MLDESVSNGLQPRICASPTVTTRPRQPIRIERQSRNEPRLAHEVRRGRSESREGLATRPVSVDERRRPRAQSRRRRRAQDRLPSRLRPREILALAAGKIELGLQQREGQ